MPSVGGVVLRMLVLETEKGHIVDLPRWLYEADFRSLVGHSFESRDTIELMPIAALLSVNVIESLGSNLKLI
jgi:hypothetical protein